MWKFICGFFIGIALTIIGITNAPNYECDDINLFDEPIIYSIGYNKFEIFQSRYPVSLCTVSTFKGNYGSTVAIYNTGYHYNNMEIAVDKKDTVWHIGNYTYRTVNDKINVVPIIKVE